MSELAGPEDVTVAGERGPNVKAPAGDIYTINSDCIRCGVCEFMCPDRAITEVKRQAIILKSLCTGCGDCVRYCPVRAIVRRAP